MDVLVRPRDDYAATVRLLELVRTLVSPTAIDKLASKMIGWYMGGIIGLVLLAFNGQEVRQEKAWDLMCQANPCLPHDQGDFARAWVLVEGLLG